MLVKHVTAVLDAHTVPSQPVSPSLPIALISTAASPRPCTVTLALPVAGQFLFSVELSVIVSYVTCSVTSASIVPIVIVVVKLLPSFVVALHEIDVIESHLLDSQAVIPIRAIGVHIEVRPNPSPIKAIYTVFATAWFAVILFTP